MSVKVGDEIRNLILIWRREARRVNGFLRRYPNCAPEIVEVFLIDVGTET